jgi:hypothetical protein
LSERTLNEIDGVARSPALQRYNTQHVQGIEMLRVQRQYLAVEPLRLLELAGLVEFEAARQCATHTRKQLGFCGRSLLVHVARCDSYSTARIVSPIERHTPVI